MCQLFSRIFLQPLVFSFEVTLDYLPILVFLVQIPFHNCFFPASLTLLLSSNCYLFLIHVLNYISKMIKYLFVHIIFVKNSLFLLWFQGHIIDFHKYIYIEYTHQMRCHQEDIGLSVWYPLWKVWDIIWWIDIAGICVHFPRWSLTYHLLRY